MMKNIWKQQYWEYLIPTLAAISLLASGIIISSKKFFWNDELLSFYLLDDRSLPHMLSAWSDKFNQAPPFYFLTGWAWDKIFGSNELSLRLFSSAALSLACLVVWKVLRRTYDFWSTTVGTLSVFCLSELVLYHNAELRMYGLFTAVCAFGLLQYDSINQKQKYSLKTLILNSLIHSAIVLTHLYGVFYSVAILVAFVIYDRYRGTFRRGVYLSVLAGWSILICLAPIIINQSNNSAKWFYRFSFLEGINLLIPFSKFVLLILSMLIISVFLSAVSLQSHDLPKLGSDELPKQNLELPLLILSTLFMLVPIIAWVITATIKPLLNDRYIIPTIAIGWPIMLTYLNSKINPVFQSKYVRISINNKYFFFLNFRTILLFSLTLVILLYPIYYAKKFSLYSQKPGVNDSSHGYVDLPIALEAGHDFLPRFYYSSKPSRYFHILDWETAVKNTGSAFATGDYVHMNAISTHYPFIQSIQSNEFIDKNNQFLVLNEEDQKWFESRIEGNDDYQVRKLGEENGAFGSLTMFLVERKNRK